jgi:Tfp pilus assembly protein PilF
MNRRQRRAAQSGGGQGPKSPARRILEQGLRDHRANRFAQALDAYRRALQLDPRSIDAHMNLGVMLTNLGQQTEARKHFAKALAIESDNAAMRRDYASALVEFGCWDEALAELARAIQLEPGDARAHANKGFVLLENGRKKEALDALECAIKADPMFAPAHFTKHVVLYDQSDPKAATDALTQAVAYDPGSVFYRFHLAVLLDQLGQAKAARQHIENLDPDKNVYRGAVDSWDYVKSKRGPATRIFATTREALLYGLQQAKIDGLVMEFGVRYGTSIRWIAENAPGTVHGFDSFKGLPQAWHIQPESTYSTHGELPKVPPNVELVVGRFDQTLPGFVASHEGPVRYMNVDCDLYESAKVVLDALGDRIVPGTVIVFDEYIINDRWRDDEFKAFQEAVLARGWKYEYLGFGMLTQQAVVRML